MLSDRVRALKRPLVFTNGVFDILHRGHVTYLAQARALGACLVVALNSDASVKRLGKGGDRPMNTLARSHAVVAALESVALVTWFDEDTPIDRILACKPDHLVKGGDWSVDKIVGAKEVTSWGGPGPLDRIRARPFHEQAPRENSQVNDRAALDGIMEGLKAIVGAAAVFTDDIDRAPYESDWRDQWHGRAAAVVKPGSTEEVARVVKFLSERKIAIVPQGGNTSMCGGSVPDTTGTQVIVNLSRMNRIRNVDAANSTMTVEAGCVLATLQETAGKHDRLFPLSLGAEGSCEIGGNLSTNAGGTGVLRYGNTRELVMGLEVVLPDGTIWNGLRALRKDNTGYDLKQLSSEPRARWASSPPRC